MVNEFDTTLVDTVDVSVNVDSVTIGPVIGLVDVKFVKSLADFDLVNVFRDVNHLSSVLDQTTILTFRGFVGAEASPLGRVQVTSFKVRLTANQWRGYTAHVGKSSEVGRTVKQLADTRTSTDPISCSECVHDF